MSCCVFLFFSFAESCSRYEPQYFHYLNQSSTVTVPTINDREWYKETLHSMQTMNFSKHEQDSVFQILAAILHFGNVSFVENKEGYADVDPQVCVCVVEFFYLL